LPKEDFSDFPFMRVIENKLLPGKNITPLCTNNKIHYLPVGMGFPSGISIAWMGKYNQYGMYRMRGITETSHPLSLL
jgi:hypothetical protein